VVVHHDLTTADEYFDSLILLKQRLYAHGTPEQVLHPELLSEVYEGKLRVFAHLPAAGQSEVDQRGTPHE
jgi:ABC-type hemin transport system ATPase subunit